MTIVVDRGRNRHKYFACVRPAGHAGEHGASGVSW